MLSFILDVMQYHIERGLAWKVNILRRRQELDTVKEEIECSIFDIENHK